MIYAQVISSEERRETREIDRVLVDPMELGTEAQKYVWEGAIPLQIHLHESEVTTLPSPPPVHILGPRLGYLPLLAPLIKPHFNNTLPPGVDTVWFDYKGLPLKWYIPTGVLFDLLCVEPERPWNLTVHFRGYPGELLTPCDDEDSVKWSFINSLKEAAYIINGNCKNVMNMSQSDQLELWRCVATSNMKGYLRISYRLKLGTVGEACATRMTSCSVQRQHSIDETDIVGPIRTGRIPVRLYMWNVGEDLDDLEAVPTIDSWDKISYINIPVEIHKEEGKYHTLRDTLKTLLPDFFADGPSTTKQIMQLGTEEELIVPEATSSHVNISRSEVIEETSDTKERESFPTGKAKIKLIRIQGIEPKLDIPFSWVANNLMNPDYFLHICVCVGVSTDQVEGR